MDSRLLLRLGNTSDLLTFSPETSRSKYQCRGGSGGGSDREIRINGHLGASSQKTKGSSSQHSFVARDCSLMVTRICPSSDPEGGGLPDPAVPSEPQAGGGEEALPLRHDAALQQQPGEQEDRPAGSTRMPISYVRISVG